MSPLVYRISSVLCQALARVPTRTNLGLLHLLFALVSGRFLSARGAVFSALAHLGLSDGGADKALPALPFARAVRVGYVDRQRLGVT